MNEKKTLTINDLRKNNHTPNILIDEEDFKDEEKEVGTVDVAVEEIDVDKSYIATIENSEEKQEIAAGETVEVEENEPKIVEEDKIVISKKDEVEEEIQDDSKKDDDEDEEEKEEETRKENLKEVQRQLKSIIKPVKNVIDLTQFKISNKAINSTNAAPSENLSVSDWVLYSMKKLISMQEFKGYDLNAILDTTNGRSTYNKYKDIFERIFNHIKSAKPKTMMEWAKITRFAALDDVYFSAFKASFEGSNYIAYQCPHCNKVHVSGDIPMDKMVKYNDDIARETVESVLQSSCEEAEYDVIFEQVSDDYVVGYKQPSIYDVIFEPSLLEEKFREKYADLLELLVYIDSIYYINRETKELRPIDLELFENNPAKTFKSKIRKYTEIINTLSSDQYFKLTVDIADIQKEETEGVTYIMPGFNCPHCKKDVKETEMTAQRLLFMRHQLVSLANM